MSPLTTRQVALLGSIQLTPGTETCGISHDLWIPKVQDGIPKIAKLPTKKVADIYGLWYLVDIT